MNRSDLIRQFDGGGGINGNGNGVPVPAMPAYAPMPGPGEATRQKSVLQILWRGSWLILICVVVALVIGLIYFTHAPKIYASSSRIWIQGDVPIMTTSTGGLSGNRDTDNYLPTQCEVIRSAQILAPMLADHGDEAMEWETLSTAVVGGREGERRINVEDAIGTIKANLNASVGKTDDLITVTFKSPNAKDAASIVNCVVDQYILYLRQHKQNTAKEIMQVLIAERDKSKNHLEDLSNRIIAFKTANPTMSYSGEHANIVVEQLAMLSQAKLNATLEAMEAETAYSSAAASAGDPAARMGWLTVNGNAQVQYLNQAIMQVTDELRAVAKEAGAASPVLKRLRDQLDGLYAQVQNEADQAFNAYLAGLLQKAKMARMHEEQIQKAVDEQQQKVASLNAAQASYDSMFEEKQREERVCEMLDQRIKEVEIVVPTGGSGVSTVDVLEKAVAGTQPVEPSLKIVVFLSVMAGLVTGCGLAYVRDWADQRMTSADEMQAILGCNVLGVLPYIPAGENATSRGQKVHLEPMSEIAEAYRTIRTAIYFGAPEGKFKTILVTSPAPGDGKTTSASNLAIAMAQAGQRVLLMDCDFRKPMQAKIFGIDDSIGMSSVVSGQELLSKAVKPTPTPGLYLLPSGPIPRNPSEILNSQRFAQILQKVKEKFDHIVIDSPPILPVTDARILGATCDVTVMVLRAAKSTRRGSQQAFRHMMSVGSRILGVVVNGVSRRQGGYGYQSYGYYRYGYGGSPKALTGPEGKTDGIHIGAGTPSNS